MSKKKSKKRKYTKEDYFRLFMMFVIGALFSSGVAYVTAAKLIDSKEVRYDNSASGLTADNVQGAIEELNNNATNFSALTTRLNNIGKEVYPVGSIYISVSSTNPGNIFGGTWVAFGTGRTLMGVNVGDSSFNTVEKTGGQKSVNYTPAGKNTGGAVGNHTLTISEIPAHHHAQATYNGVSGVMREVPTGVPYGYDYGDGYGEVPTANTGGGGAHNHPFTQPTFTGTQASIATLSPYITVYMWKRTA